MPPAFGTVVGKYLGAGSRARQARKRAPIFRGAVDPTSNYRFNARAAPMGVSESENRAFRRPRRRERFAIVPTSPLAELQALRGGGRARPADSRKPDWSDFGPLWSPVF